MRIDALSYGFFFEFPWWLPPLFLVAASVAGVMLWWVLSRRNSAPRK